MPRDFLNEDNAPEQESFKAIPRDFLSEENQPESKLTSAVLAVPRVGEDTIKRAYNAVRSIPQYYESAKMEVPGVFDVLQQQPRHAAGQAVAGLAELGRSVFNTPHDIVNYMTNRLHLVPHDINQKVQMARMPEDTEEAINNVFGQPKYPGEELIRGTTRNALNLVGGGLLGNKFNPLQLTNKGVAKKVVNELNNQVEQHTDRYNSLWGKADKQGFNQVPFDQKELNNDMSFIKKYYTPRQYKSIEDFSNNPSLENAQRAQSDLGSLRRALEEKSRTNALLGEERNIYDSISNAEKNIEGNMFKNNKGELNNKLADEYRKISKSYRENVVPYKYDPSIQDYLNKDITAKQLVQRLSQGPFAAKKGGLLTHPQFGIRNALLPILGGVGVIGGGKYLYDQSMGNPLSHQQQS